MIKLVPVGFNDLSWLMHQRNRIELMKYFRQNIPLTITDQIKWWSDQSKSNRQLFIIRDNETNVGYVGLAPINAQHNHAEFGIFIIPEFQGKSYGKKALMLLLEYGFEKLKLHKIYSDVMCYPKEDRFKFYNDIGFKIEGINREHYFKNGGWIDSIQFSLLDREWEKIKNG